MEYLQNLLTQNPIISTIVIILGVVCGIVTLILGAKKVYNDFLSKSVKIPAWLLCLIILFIFPIIGLKLSSEDPNKPYLEIKGETFGAQVVNLDGKSFINCSFTGSALEYSGKSGFEINNCEFDRIPKFILIGPAGNALKAMTIMYSSPVFKTIIDESLKNIKNGIIKESTPINIRVK